MSANLNNRMDQRLSALTMSAIGLLLLSTGLSAKPSKTSVRVTSRLLTTSEDGPTSTSGTSSNFFEVGESARLFAVAGQLAGHQGRCSWMFSGAPSSDETITPRIQNEFEGALAGDGYFWDLLVTIEEISLDSALLELDWSRLGGLGGRREKIEHKATLRLPIGSRRLLEHVPFEAPASDSSCRVSAYHLELEVAPVPIAPMADRDLIYELWFARSRDGRREEFAATEILAGQAEEVPFRVPALRQVLPGVRSTQGNEVTLAAQSRGTIRAWSTGPRTLAIQIRPSLHHGLGPPLDTSFSSGEGSKLFQAQAGETIELELPEVYTRLTVPAEGITLADSAVDGIAVVGPGLKLDFHSLLGSARYSLLVRVHFAD